MIALAGLTALVIGHAAAFSLFRGPTLVHPARLFIGLSALKTVPYAILSALFIDLIDVRVLREIAPRGELEVIAEFAFLYSLYILTFAVTLRILLRPRWLQQVIGGVQTAALRAQFSLLECTLLAVMAASLFAVKVWSAGWSNTIFGSELQRTSAIAGLGYVAGLADAAVAIASATALMCWARTRTGTALTLAVCMLLFAAVSFTMFGGRKALIQHVLLLLILCDLPPGFSTDMIRSLRVDLT